MKVYVWLRNLCACAFLVVGVQSPDIDAREGGTSGSGVFSGMMQRCSSIVVNDTVIKTDNTTIITVNGDSTATDADLRVGQQLLVHTRPNSDPLLADEVVYDATVLGPIRQMNPANLSFTVFNTVFQTSPVTNFEDVGWADLRPSQRLQNWSPDLSGKRY